MPNEHPYTRNSISQAEISTIPIFNGDPNVLPLYIDACEDLIRTYADVVIITNPINSYLVRIIKSRLGGQAQSLIGSRRLNTWHDIRALLQTSFLDQRSEDCLLNDLTSEQPKKSENPYTFGQRIKDLLNLLLTKMQLDTPEEMIPLKTNLYKNSALQTYKRGLMRYGRLGEVMYLKNPPTLERAMSDVLEYQNWQYRCGLSPAPQSQHKVTQQMIPGQMTTPSPRPTMQFPTRSPPTQSQLNPIPIRPNFYRPNTMPSHQTHTQPQPFTYPNRALPPPQKPSSFRFAKTPGQQIERRQPRQQPMDIDPSLSKMRTKTPFGPSYPQNKWVSEELHQQEGYEAEGYEFYEQHEFQPIWDESTEPFPWEAQEEQNFPIEASVPEDPPPNNQQNNQPNNQN